MKKQHLLSVLFLLLCAFPTLAQTPYAPGQDYLGLLCRIDVNTKLDETIGGYATYDIPEINNKIVYLYGPGRPQITPEGKLKLWLKEIELELLDDETGIQYIEVCVYNRWGNPSIDEDYWKHPEYLGYYIIELVVKKTIY